MMKCSSAKKSLLRKGSIVWSFLAEFYRYWREGIWAKLCMLHLCIIVHNRAPVHLARNSMSLFLDITMVVEKSFQQTSGSNFPGWIFCPKLVIFCLTLSHFFDHTRNGSIKSDLIFLYNFSTRVRICNQI